MFNFLFHLTIKSMVVSFVLVFLFWFGLSFSSLHEGVAVTTTYVAVQFLSPFIMGGTALYMVLRG